LASRQTSTGADQQTTEQLPAQLGDSSSDGAAFSLLVVCPGVTSTYPLAASGRLLIGRASNAQIRIDHASVSREHALLELGEPIRIEDLGSANGTRVGEQRLAPHQPATVAPNEVIDLGEVLLVVQHRRLEQRLSRVCEPAFFELRLEEEQERAGGLAPSFAVVRLKVEGELEAQAVLLLVASQLAARELVCSPDPSSYRLLLLEHEPAQVGRRLERLSQLLAGRGLVVHAATSTPPPASKPASSRTSYAPLVVEDPAMLRVCRLLERVAESDLGVILLGETGVGKEMCAALLHRFSPRAKARLLCLNCAALSESLLEAELFGHERGAFTGATGDKLGLLESASGGSVFLDEVGDMPLATQVKLLRVLEAKEVLRIGSRSPRPLDVRVIAATNRDLHERVTAGLFREDLFYRLNGISILVPPLRERPADIVPLARHFAKRALKEGRPALPLSPASLAFLGAQHWAGNVRELKNAVERALVLCDGPSIEPEHLSDLGGRRATSAAPPADGLRAEVEALERQRIEQALSEAGGSQRRAATLLGISRGALLRRLSQYGLTAKKE
jgi:DNA-binding NtrC family response regulator